MFVDSDQLQNLVYDHHNRLTVYDIEELKKMSEYEFNRWLSNHLYDFIMNNKEELQEILVDSNYDEIYEDIEDEVEEAKEELSEELEEYFRASLYRLCEKYFPLKD